MSKKYNISSKSDMRKLERHLLELAKQQTISIKCPHCQKQIDVHEGKNICPFCKKNVDVKFNIK